MPLDTFFNLPIQKQNRITEASITEFSNMGYHKASIGTIASKAGVSKGSMYQYFKNKRELFMYVLDFCVKEKIEFTSELISQNEGIPFFHLLENLLTAGVEFAKQFPYTYRIYEEINKGVPEDIRDEINLKLNSTSQAYYLNFLKEGSKMGELRDDIDIELAAFLVYTSLKEFGQYIADNIEHKSEEDIREHIRQFIEIMKNGLKNKGELK